mmetsp:Transcript_4045/g.9037  ORF Transcript_4045/g.9037 Transcript_4045/m.9037 type:complete len:80 (-) Transcript_4045:397-636(-)
MQHFRQQLRQWLVWTTACSDYSLARLDDSSARSDDGSFGDGGLLNDFGRLAILIIRTTACPDDGSFRQWLVRTTGMAAL